MPKRVVYLGDFNNNKSTELVEEVVKRLESDNGSSFYYLLPNGDLLKKYRKYFISRLGSTFELNVFTFDDVVEEILSMPIEDFKYLDKNIDKNNTIENGEKVEIHNPIQNIIIRDIVVELEKESKLEYYKELTDLDGFIDSVNDIIGEIKRSLISPRDYIKRSPDSLKYKEISYIYEKYEKILDRYKLSDREGKYFESIYKLKHDNYLKNLDSLIIDQFYNFRPIELAILEEIVKSETDIYINMPFFTERNNIALKNTLMNLKILGFEIITLNKKKSYNTFELISKNMFSNKRKRLKNKKDEINEIVAPTKDIELEKVFQEIKTLHLKGVKLEDIGLIIPSKEYENLVLQRAKLESIPISKSYSEKLIEQPLIREVLNIIENKISEASKPSLINRIKSRYFQLFEFEKRELYERFLRENKFKDLRELEEALSSNRLLNIEEKDLDLIINVNNIIGEEINSIPDYAKVEEYNNLIIDLIKKYEVSRNILRSYNDEYKDLFLRDMETINKLEDILEEISLSFIKEKYVSIEDYKFILEQFFKEAEIVIYKGNTKGVHILSPVASRGIDKEVLFVVGMIQGEYPSLEQNGYFINDYEIDKLLEMGIDTKEYQERLDIEILNLASGIAKVKNKLYLSYSKGSSGSNVESIFLEEIKNLIDLKLVNTIELDFDYNIKTKKRDIKNKRDLINYSINFIKEKKFISEELYKINEELNENIFKSLAGKNIGEYFRENNINNEYTGILKNKNIIKKLSGYEYKSYSISQLENYAACPYKYYMTYILSLEEMVREYELYSPLNVGNIYHNLLKDYYEHFRVDIYKNIKKGSNFNIDGSFDYLSKILKKEVEKFNLDYEDSNDKLLIDNISNKLQNYIYEDIHRLYKWKKYPIKLESKFGEENKFYIEVNNRKIYLRGIIDRIDKSIYSDKYLLIDYKSSSGNLGKYRNIDEGSSFQLPVYIMSQEDNIVAAAYGIIKTGELEVELGIREETNIIGRRKKGAKSREELENLLNISKNHIYKIVTEIERGNFSLKPVNCSEYCIYKDICRYEDKMEVGI